MKDLTEFQKKLIDLMKEKKVSVILTPSPIQEPNHVTQERIKRLNGGLTIVDHINLIK